MKDRAPDGQPTANIKRQMDHAEGQLRYWERVESTAGKTLSLANREQVHWSKALASLRNQYDARLLEERNRGPRGDQGPPAPTMNQSHYSDQRER